MPNILELLGLIPRDIIAPQVSSNIFGPKKAPAPTSTKTQTTRSFGVGNEDAYIQKVLFDALMQTEMTDEERINIAELSGQESSYGYAGPHISPKEESYGPFHVNLKAGRVDPNTGKAFTKEGATDISTIIQYVLDEMRRTGGLGAWNPGAYDFYQEGIPERAKTKKFIRGD